MATRVPGPTAKTSWAGCFRTGVSPPGGMRWSSPEGSIGRTSRRKDRSGVLRRVAASVGRSRPFAWMVAWLERLDHEAPDLLRVLTYHRVETPAAGHPPGLSVAPDAFEE